MARVDGSGRPAEDPPAEGSPAEGSPVEARWAASRRRPHGRLAASPSRPPLSLVLASASPQRRAILARLGIDFVVVPANVAEDERGDPLEVAATNALRKARAVAASYETTPLVGAGQPATRAAGDLLVLGVDTLVSLGGAIFGKPPDAAAARATLASLSGATHRVVSGLALVWARPSAAGSAHGDGVGHSGDAAAAAERVLTAVTDVTFRPLDDQLLDWYVGTGEWRGRAGGYAIQGAGAALVRRVDGDYENVVGLPVAALLDACPELLPTGSPAA